MNTTRTRYASSKQCRGLIIHFVDPLPRRVAFNSMTSSRLLLRKLPLAEREESQNLV